jgi:hypothetical protein
MTMTPRLRKLALTAHVTFSVGWLGAVVAYLALAIAGLTSHDAQMGPAAYLAMELIGWFVIVPCALASLLTGLVQSLGTEWGLFRHYWILAKLVLTAVATVVLLVHMPTVSRMSGIVSEVVHAGGGLLVLLTTTTLSVYKPWGMIWYGRHSPDWTTSTARWVMVFGIIVVVLMLLFVILHLTGKSLHGR